MGRRIRKIISHIKLEDLPIEFIFELAIPKRIGRMKSHITWEFLKVDG